MDIDRRTAGQAAWRSIVGPTPRLGPDDRSGAAMFLSRIQRALDQGGWRRGERVRLHKMKRTWTARAEGRDERYRQYGNRPKDNRAVVVNISEGMTSHESRQNKRPSDRNTDGQTQGGDTVTERGDETGITDDDPRVRAASKKNWGWGR